MNNSVILTIHNKDFLIANVLTHLLENLSTFNNELIIVFDGCQDNSESITKQILSNVKNKKIKYIYTDDVFETKANNAGLRVVENDYVIIIQDDMVIKEKNFDLRMAQPFIHFSDVFAVTSFIAHNNIYNEETKEINYIDMANRSNSSRDVFYGREYANRGPLMYNYNDVVKLNFLDEYFAPQCYDDMDISMRALKELGKISGLYWIDYESDLSWGTTRRAPSPKLNNIHITNAAKVLEKHRDLLYSDNRIIDNRILK
jgi:hypothetical protein